MRKDLIDKLIALTNPGGGFDGLRADFEASFGSLAKTEAQKIAFKKALSELDPAVALKIARTFCEEYFADDTLKAAVEFFGSDVGQCYLEQRRLSGRAAAAALNQYVLDIVKRHFEGVL